MSAIVGESVTEVALTVPAEFAPDPNRRLPLFSNQTFAQLTDHGFAGAGVISAVIERTRIPDDPNILVLHHRKGDAWGLLSETVKGDDTAIENPEDTISRAFGEELAIANIARLRLLMPARGGWVALPALRDRNVPGHYLLGVAIPLFTSTVSLEEIASTIPETPEISQVRVRRLTDILRTDEDQLRAFAKPTLWALGAAGLYEREVPTVPFRPAPFDATVKQRPDFTISAASRHLTPVI